MLFDIIVVYYDFRSEYSSRGQNVMGISHKTTMSDIAIKIRLIGTRSALLFITSYQTASNFTKKVYIIGWISHDVYYSVLF